MTRVILIFVGVLVILAWIRAGSAHTPGLMGAGGGSQVYSQPQPRADAGLGEPRGALPVYRGNLDRLQY